MSDANTVPAIWKISHGTEATSGADPFKPVFEKRQVAVVANDTRAKAGSAVTQGDDFRYTIKKGDYFYLCYGSSIRLLGQFTGDASENPELAGWSERPYRIIAQSKNTAPFQTAEKGRWWMPSDNSTCIKVPDKHARLFESIILLPYFGMTLNELYQNPETPHYWWLVASPKIWRFSSLGVGEEVDYSFYNENNNKRRVFQNFQAARPGDLVIGYESNPVKKITALTKISRVEPDKLIYFQKTEGLQSPIDYAELQQYPELRNMEFFGNPNGSLFKLTADEYNFILDLIREQNPLPQNQANLPRYTKEDFLREVYLSGESLDTLCGLLKNKKNVILQGAPGVGKTFTARRLAYAMMGEQDDSRIEFIQFHQSSSYEDFIMGYRPTETGFQLEEGIFYRFCKAAENHPDKDYFFIIDEINRGNLSKIFGELLMLIEKDYRGPKHTVVLTYSKEPFSVPQNLYLIGMMNTADRSLAMIDYALRRRFSFFDMEPAFDCSGSFQAYIRSLGSASLDALLAQVTALNAVIRSDPSLGPGFQLGHSYFCGLTPEDCTTARLKAIVLYDLVPTLAEYWFDEPDKQSDWKSRLLGCIQ